MKKSKSQKFKKFSPFDLFGTFRLFVFLVTFRLFGTFGFSTSRFSGHFPTFRDVSTFRDFPTFRHCSIFRLFDFSPFFGHSPPPVPAHSRSRSQTTWDHREYSSEKHEKLKSACHPVVAARLQIIVSILTMMITRKQIILKISMHNR